MLPTLIDSCVPPALAEHGVCFVKHLLIDQQRCIWKSGFCYKMKLIIGFPYFCLLILGIWGLPHKWNRGGTMDKNPANAGHMGSEQLSSCATAYVPWACVLKSLLLPLPPAHCGRIVWNWDGRVHDKHLRLQNSSPLFRAKGLRAKVWTRALPSQETKCKGYGREANRDFQSGDPGSIPALLLFRLVTLDRPLNLPDPLLSLVPTSRGCLRRWKAKSMWHSSAT